MAVFTDNRQGRCTDPGCNLTVPFRFMWDGLAVQPSTLCLGVSFDIWISFLRDCYSGINTVVSYDLESTATA